jgi:microcystin-dependent protein
LIALFAALAHATDTGVAGGGQPIDTMQPSIALTVLIAKQGATSGPETGTVYAGDGLMIGEIRLFAGNFVPGGYLAADGTILSTTTEAGLFGVIGNAFGGNGSTTFRLPDLRGRVMAGMGDGQALTPRTLAETFGTESVTLSLSQMTAHSHTVAGSPTSSTGGGQQLPTVQPSLAVHPMICLTGSFEYLPEVRIFGGGYMPAAWQTCDGSELLIAENDVLFIQLGTVYGGDGNSTFRIPDLRGRIAIGQGQGAGLPYYDLGESTGDEQFSPTFPPSVPPHAHTVATGITDFTGTGLSYPNLQPTLAMRYIIATSGLVPSTGSTNTSATPNLGEIRLFASSAPPSGWVFAEGQLLSRSANANLFAILGTTYGAGDGVTTFALPDLRGRAPLGAGQGTGLTNRNLAVRVGTVSSAVSLSQAPSHAHTIDPSGLRHPGEPQTGATLRVTKTTGDPTKIDLSWGTGCSSGVTGYAVYEGTLGAFGSHAIFNGACGTSGTFLSAQPPGAGNRYYLITAVDDLVGEEGSYGHATSGEIGRAAVPCRPAPDLATCN